MYVSDALPALVDLYQRLADAQSEIHSMLRDLATAYERRNKADRKKWYYELREAYTLGFDDPDTEAAVLFAMLRTCYNGMFRTNRKTGRFDTPAGFMEAKTMYDPDKVEAFGEMIRGLARLVCRDCAGGDAVCAQGECTPAGYCPVGCDITEPDACGDTDWATCAEVPGYGAPICVAVDAVCDPAET